MFIYIYMDISENSGTSKSSILIGFSIIFTIHFGVPLFFGDTHIYIYINTNTHIFYMLWYVYLQIAHMQYTKVVRFL